MEMGLIYGCPFILLEETFETPDNSVIPIWLHFFSCHHHTAMIQCKQCSVSPDTNLKCKEPIKVKTARVTQQTIKKDLTS